MRVKLYWLRAHIGTLGNKSADELVKQAAQRKKTSAEYGKFPISCGKRIIRTEAVVYLLAKTV